MSITPMVPQLPAVAPTGAAVSAGPGAGDPAAAGFAALVADLLAGHAAILADHPSVVVPRHDEPPPEVPTEEVAAAEELEEQLNDPTHATHLLVSPALAALVAPAQVPTGTAAPTGDPATAPRTGGAAPVAEAGPAAAPPTEQRILSAEAPAADTGTGPEAGPTVATLPTAASAQPAAQPAGPTSPPVDIPAPSAMTAPSVAPAPSATPVASGPTTASHPVTAQVIPEVTRLVSQGNGTHRMVMTLRPEALGEVRVTLTVRDGEVHVRFAAGDEAQRALVEGAPELRRVLELAGAAETRVVVRDLSQPATAGTTPTTPTPTHAGGEGRGDTAAADHGHRGPQDQHARTRAGTTATDGLSDGVQAPRPEPVRHARSSGVDLTM